MNNLYDVLETCLDELENGTDVDTLLFRYPEYAEELRPILEASIQAKSLVVPEPSSDVVRRSRARVMQLAATMREAQAIPSKRVWSVPIRRALVSLAVIALLFVSSTGLVQAASTTLPGDNLYPVKRTWEDFRLLLTLDAQMRAALEVEHENERLEELNELFAEGRSAKVDFAGFITSQNGDRWLVAKIPVRISAQTELRDMPLAVGDAVRVRGYSQGDGTVLAERVERLSAGAALPDIDEDDLQEIEQENSKNDNEAGEDHSGRGSGDERPRVENTKAPDEKSSPRISSMNGTVDSVNGTILVVNGQLMNYAGAEIKGTPKAGASVKVEGYFDESGRFIVTKIEFEDSESGGGGGSEDGRSNNDENNDDNSGEENSNDGGSDDHGGGNSGSGGGGGDDD